MRLPHALVALLAVALSLHAQAPGNDTSQLPLLPPRDPDFPTLHTSLRTLLPLLPLLSPPPSHTLVVTFATPAFRTLLLNWVCFLRHKARWADPRPGTPRRARAADVPKFLVVSSDAGLAHELADMGIVVWLLRAADLDGLEDEEEDMSAAAQAKLERELEDDTFLTLRLMDLLLPPKATAPDDRSMRDDYIEWGTLQYQSLMLGRSLVLSALTGALVDAQRVEVEDRKREEADWARKSAAHDWETGPCPKEEWVGVKGVLVVDNDAVWLSSPASFLAHPYRPTGTHPSIIFAADSAPTFINSWGTYSMPCACFFYARTADGLAHTVPSLPLPDAYRPASDAAHAWRAIAMCHIAMLQRELATARRQAARLADPTTAIDKLVRGVAPSFQATAMGPALFLAAQAVPVLPRVDHEQWMTALGSGEVEDLLAILDDAGLGVDDGASCLELAAERNWAQSPNPDFRPASPPLVAHADAHRPIRVESLPFGMFPPGMSYFGRDQEEGIKPCVVHANYATGTDKERLLRERGLWALRGGEHSGEAWTCDAPTMVRA